MSSISIRQGTFETNSSSAHTIILVENPDKIDAKELVEEYLNSRGSMYDDSGRRYFPIPLDSTGDKYCFGSSFAIYLDWEEKMAYLIASVSRSKEMRHSIVKMLRNIVGVDIAGISTHLEEWAHSYVEGRGDREVLEIASTVSTSDYCGNIDHQSMDTIDACLDAMKKLDKYKNMSLEELFYEIVFSQEIAIVEDSDCSDGLSSVIISNIISLNTITHVLCTSYSDGYENVKGKFISTEDYLQKSEGDD